MLSSFNEMQETTKNIPEEVSISVRNHGVLMNIKLIIVLLLVIEKRSDKIIISNKWGLELPTNVFHPKIERLKLLDKYLMRPSITG